MKSVDNVITEKLSKVKQYKQSLLGEEELEQRNMQISESARPVPQQTISVCDVDLTGFDE